MELNPQLFESTVSDILSASYPGISATVKPTKYFDFEYIVPGKPPTLIEVKGKAPDGFILGRIRNFLDKIHRPEVEFILLTPESPTSTEMLKFGFAFSQCEISAKWLGLKEFINEIGLKDHVDVESGISLSELKVRSITKNIERYITSSYAVNAQAEPTERLENVSEQKQYFSRQFPYAFISSLSDDETQYESVFKIGERYPKATIVLTDLKNFSSIVSASSQDDLTEMMTRYYRRAREAVFNNGGMLDKFIGDAVLAVFGYPKQSSDSAINSIKFANSIIEIGKEILDEWSTRLNSRIETGTRVGICTGDIWPINIGSDKIEISLLGDTINLAARLEVNSRTNGFLMDNKTKHIGSSQNIQFISQLMLCERIVKKEDAKGQRFDLNCWEKNDG